MTSITKKFATALAAVGVMASGLFANSFLVTNFNDGSNQNNIGYYYYFAYTEEVEGMRNEVFSFPTQRDSTADRLTLTGAEGSTVVQDVPIAFEVFPNQGLGGSPAGGFSLTNMPRELSGTTPVAGHLFPNQTAAYPAWKFGVMLTSADDIGFNEQHGSRTSGFEHVEAISFVAKTGGLTEDETPITRFEFAIETTNNAPGATPAYSEFDDPWFVPGRSTNFNVYRVQINPAAATMPQGVTTEDLGDGFVRYTIAIQPVTQPTGSLTTKPGAPDTTTGNVGNAVGSGRAGALTQEPYHGLLYNYNPANATKLVWTIKAQDNVGLRGNDGTLLIDDIQFHGANFTFVPHGVCPNCAGAALTGSPADYFLISNFDDNVLMDDIVECIVGEDNDATCAEKGGVWWDTRMNMLGHYWYYYTSAGIAVEDGVTVDVEDNVVIALSEGKDGAGLMIGFDMTNASRVDDDGTPITPFVGIGTNFFESLRDGTPVGTITGFDATDYEGVFFQFRAPEAVAFVNVVISDPADFARGDDGVRFSLAVPNVTPNAWTNARVKFADMVLPSWLTPDDPRYTAAFRQFSAFDLSKLAQIQFRYDGTASTEFAIDSVMFFKPNTTPVRHAARPRAAGAGLRASFNRGVVNVNWNTPTNVESGRIQLIDARGRVVSTAPLTRVNDRRVSADLGARNRIPAGRYFVRVDARDVNGRRVVQQAPVTIMR